MLANMQLDLVVQYFENLLFLMMLSKKFTILPIYQCFPLFIDHHDGGIFLTGKTKFYAFWMDKKGLLITDALKKADLLGPRFPMRSS